MNSIYKKGLHFQCQGCNYCCSVEPGFVFLSQNDLDKLVKHFSLDQETFINKYCRKVDIGIGYRISLLEKDNFDCIFLTEKGCSCYEDRPLQCKTYPFWPSIVDSEESWLEEGKSCPGIGKGDTKITRAKIEKNLEAMKEFKPIIISY